MEFVEFSVGPWDFVNGYAGRVRTSIPGTSTTPSALPSSAQGLAGRPIVEEYVAPKCPRIVPRGIRRKIRPSGKRLQFAIENGHRNK